MKSTNTGPTARRGAAGALALLLLLAGPASARAAVFVVRHAEKQTEENGKDVPLSEAGRARAARLAAMLRDLHIAAIYSTDTVRTLSTAEPLARASRLKPLIYETAGSDAMKAGPDAMKVLADRIRREHGQENVLV